MTMLNTGEILETIRMIDRENSISAHHMCVSLLNCACDDRRTLCGRDTTESAIARRI
jgi:hypothetical protein